MTVIFSMTLAGIFLLLSTGIGIRVLKRLDFVDTKSILGLVLAISIGMGVIAYLVLVLGLLQLFNRSVFVILLILLGVVSWRELLALLGLLVERSRRLFYDWRQLSLDRKILLAAGVILFSFTLLQALTPPWDYDGLLYHLEGPKEFLSAGGIQPSPQNWLTYYPSTIEMIFTLGLGLGSESFGRLVHLTFGIILVVSTYDFAKRTIGDWAAWLAAFILVGIPIFPIWANLAYVDMAWAVYTFLATYTAINWDRTQNKGWLIVAGVLMGFGLGTKYLAFGGLIGIAAVIFLLGLRFGLTQSLQSTARFAVIALLVGSPWYLKNFLWTGNPLYPLLVPPSGWSSERLRLWTTYMESFGVSHTWIETLLLPVRLFTQHEQFATFLGSIEFPSFLFPLVVIYPFVRKTKPMNVLAGTALLEFVVWSLSARQTRYLLPIFPNLSILVAYIISEIAKARLLGRWFDLLAKAIVFAMVTITMIYSGIFFLKISPIHVLIGKESKEGFLLRNVGDYGAMKFIESNLSPTARVFFMWDGRKYYCDDRCVPDIDHAQWTELFLARKSHEDLLTRLREMGITHLYLSIEDVDFMLQHDPTGQHRQALEYFLTVFKPECTRQVYQDPNGGLYELACDQAGESSGQLTTTKLIRTQ